MEFKIGDFTHSLQTQSWSQIRNYFKSKFILILKHILKESCLTKVLNSSKTDQGNTLIMIK